MLADAVEFFLFLITASYLTLVEVAKRCLMPRLPVDSHFASAKSLACP